VQDVELFVLAVDIATFETRAQDVVNPAAILDYSLLGLPAGDYLLVAGSDDDEDGFICGPGDRYCGFLSDARPAAARDRRRGGSAGGSRLHRLDAVLGHLGRRTCARLRAS
jgi:hypothetical protein